MPRLVTIVQPNIDDVRIRLGQCNDLRAHSGEARQVARRGRIGAGGRLGSGIDGEDVVVFIAVVVLGVKDVLAVAAPEIVENRPLRLRGQEASRAEGFIHALYINVACVLPRFEKSQILAVGRNLCESYFRIAEDGFTIDDRWKSGES